jgi:hypothetical protein
MAAAICEVGPRDELENEPDVLSRAVRGELANRMATTGFPVLRQQALLIRSVIRKWSQQRKLA